MRSRGGRQAGNWSLSLTTALLERVRTQFCGDVVAEDALTRVEGDPADPGALADLQRVVVMHMTRDQLFAEDVVRMADQASVPSRPGHVTTVNADSIKNSVVYNDKVEVAGDLNFS